MPPKPRGPRPRLFLYVQHLLGIGHVHRAARIAKVLAAEGFDVLVSMGGVPHAGLDFGEAGLVHLPPVKAGPQGFAALVQADGSPFDVAAAESRTARLLAEFDRFAPDILLTEAFPFGRSQMRFELLPLLDRAKHRHHPPLIASSVRDILQRNRRPARVAETVALVERYYDLVLVHGDPHLAPLRRSFPAADAFEAKVIHTGLVAPDPITRRDGLAPYAAVVSAGGGAVGASLLQAALLARPMTRIADRSWLFLTGPNLPADIGAQLQLASDPFIEVRRFVPDLAQLLARAELSVSQAGYNTVTDVLAAGCRAVVVPYAQDGETEQGDRAALLDDHGLAVCVREEGLTPGGLAKAIDRALDRSANLVHPFDLDGARETARILRGALARRSVARDEADHTL